MIETLRIERLAIVERAELEFGPGLNVLTGETGAGKSIVLGALALLVGGRASADGVREGDAEGAVEALFRTDCHPELEAELARRDIPSEDGELVVRRSVQRSGRSRARLGGQLAPASMLAELFDGRIEISSQHSSQSLLRLATHGRLLDAFGGLLDLRADVERGVESLRALDAEIAELRSASEERERRRDFLAFQIAEIDEAEIEDGELAEIESEHARLAHAERIREEGGAAVAALSGDPAASDDAGAGDRLAAAARALASLSRLDPSLGPLAERLQALAGELGDVAADLERQLDGIEADPARLGRVEERLALLERLQQKYGRGEAELRATRARLAGELEGVEGADQRTEQAMAQREQQARALEDAARKLSEARVGAARRLAKAVEATLCDLSMPDSRFSVALDAASPPDGLPCGSAGLEVPEFRFAANPGEPLRPLRKVASGGELSRVFLAVKSALRQAGRGVVLVFDEVDAGIGGGVAERVGRALADLARDHQVLCITHLPQIAALADVHFRVEKRPSRGRTRTTVTRIEGEDRVEEIARMAGGESVTEATREHARALLGLSAP
ncbi:MAG: DNA repair protein RecN [Myxococcota bacterium]